MTMRDLYPYLAISTQKRIFYVLYGTVTTVPFEGQRCVINLLFRHRSEFRRRDYERDHTREERRRDANTKHTFFDVLLTVHLRIFISVFNQLDGQILFHNEFYFMPLHVSSTCARNM